MYEVKKATIRDLQEHAQELVAMARKDRIVITQHGRPAAVLVGVSNQDWESVALQTDPKFWKLIHSRRKQPSRSLSQVKARLRSRK